MFIPKHCQLLLNFTAAGAPKAPVLAKQFLCELVEAIGMVRVTEPQAYYVTTPGNRGLTASVNLATSHICFHVFEEDKKVMLDVYSCKEFEPQIVFDTIDKYFGETSDYFWRFINRDTFEEIEC